MNLKNVKIGDVKWTKGFWADKFELMHQVSIPNMWDLLSDGSITIQNFRIAAGLEAGEHVGTNWTDGDFYKWLEAVAYVYAVTGDEKLNRLMDEVIEVIGKAQQPDGYINTQMTIPGKERFQSTQDHETYNMGHLMTAGCVHYLATGKKTLLDIALKAGDCLYNTFMYSNKHFLGYSSIKGLVKIYRTTGVEKYLQLANHFVNLCGSGDVEFRRNNFKDGRGTDLKQDRIPLRDEVAAVGHSVRGNYLYCGATDVYSETGDKELFSALERIWQDVRYKKMYITGASSPLRNGVSLRKYEQIRKYKQNLWDWDFDKVHEAFGGEYQLPNTTAYNETCSNIASAMWNWRMLNVTGDACYADMAELILYNSALSSISLDGKHFFYTNGLRRIHDIPPPSVQDSIRWTPPQGQGCCPPNIIRTISKLHSWVYSVSEKGIWVNLYGGSKLETELLDGEKIELTQETNYPWDGKIKITIGGPERKEYGLMLRIPGWVNKAECKINGRRVNEALEPGSYQELHRVWESGDVVELHLPMNIQLIKANPLVEEVKNQVAVKRGPIVYCLESPDLPDSIKVSSVMLPDSVHFKPVYKKDLLGGVMVLQSKAFSKPKPIRPWTKSLYKEVKPVQMKLIDIQLIPYYAWSNRGISEMSVWLPLAYGTDF